MKYNRRVCRETKGVREVRSNLVVDPSHVAVREGSPPSSNDQRGIASEITSADEIIYTGVKKLSRRNVGVAGSAVTLRGEVGTESERDAAGEYIARNTSGVTSVRNEIILADYARSDLQISLTNVRESLRGRPTSIRNVDITTRNALFVTLRGWHNTPTATLIT